MPINLVASVVHYKDRLAIGKDNNLLFILKKDLAYFKNLTQYSLSKNSKLPINVVVMGKNTWFSIPAAKRPLIGRINIVLTNDKKLLRISRKFSTKDSFETDAYFMTLSDFTRLYKTHNPNVFVIGGGLVYSKFLNTPDIKPDTLYITEIKGIQFDSHNVPDSFMEAPDSSYRLVGVSSKIHDVSGDDDSISYRRLIFKLRKEVISQEQQYLDLCKDVMTRGISRPDRTGVGTKSIFGKQLRFDVSQSLPLLTTKRVSFKGIIEELLFFCAGNTDTKMLEKRGVNIWRGNTSREFLDNRRLFHYDEGVMGPMYGWSWRNFGGKYSQAFADTYNLDMTKLDGFDQLAHVEHLLRTDPFSRRIFISNLNPKESSQMALEMCHIFFQLYVTEIDNQKYLSGHFVMRSNDLGCGFPFNLVSYTVLLYILALRCDMKPKEIVYTCSDCHVYTNHFEALHMQISRTPRPFPKLLIDPTVKHKDWKDMTSSDFELAGYMPHSSISMKMAI
jgi:dihydrofolate reductase/thymidylate synthase